MEILYPTELDRAWVAGFFDGEGSVSIRLTKQDAARRKKSHLVSVQIALTHLPTLQRLQSLFGGKLYNHQAGGEKRKRSWIWQIWGKSSVPFLRSILPFSQTKALEIRIMLDALKNWAPDRGKAISDELWALREGYRLALQELHHGSHS